VHQSLSADQQSLVAQIYLCQRCEIGTQAILLLLWLQVALVKALVPVVEQLPQGTRA
jgi:hypothetical protein